MIVRPLKGVDAFTAALRTGRRVAEGPATLSFIKGTEQASLPILLLGVTVSKKIAPNAVVRTRIRRLLREAVRTFVGQHHQAILESRITTMILTWRQAPSKPSLIHLSDVEPVVHALLTKALG